ncbi:MAG: DUF1648 domain-containing protein [Acidobacteriaceae bacterium]
MFTILIATLNYSALPQQIPTHFDANGLANGWSDKSFLWILVAFAAFDYILLSLIRFFPQSTMNMPVRPELRAAALPFAFAMIDWIKAETTCLLAFIVHAMFAAARGGKALTALFTPVVLGFVFVLFATSLYYIARMSRLKPAKSVAQ